MCAMIPHALPFETLNFCAIDPEGEAIRQDAARRQAEAMALIEERRRNRLPWFYRADPFLRLGMIGAAAVMVGLFIQILSS